MPHHQSEIVRKRNEWKREKEERSKQKLAELTGDSTEALVDPVDRRCAKKIGTNRWLTATPSMDMGFVLSRDEFRLGLHLAFNKIPPNLPPQCDGHRCKSKDFDLHHAMSCKLGGLVSRRHRDVMEILHYWFKKIFPAGRIRIEPMVLPMDPSDNRRADLSVHGLWESSTTAFIDVEVSHTEAPSYLRKTPEKVILSLEKTKRMKYGDIVQQHRRHFSPFVVSSDGLLGQSANNVVKHIAHKLAEVWHSPYSKLVSDIRTSLSFTLVRAAFSCAYTTRLYDSTRVYARKVKCNDGAALSDDFPF